MDGCDYGGPNQPAIGQRQKVIIIVDEVEFFGLFHDCGNMQCFPNLGIHFAVFFVWRLAYAAQFGASQRIAGGVKRDVDVLFDQSFGQQRYDAFPRAVMPGRCPPGDRGDDGNFHSNAPHFIISLCKTFAAIAQEAFILLRK